MNCKHKVLLPDTSWRMCGLVAAPNSDFCPVHKFHQDRIDCGPASPPCEGSAPGRPSKTASLGAQAEHARSPLQSHEAGSTLRGSSSAGERSLAMAEATGSIPVSRSTLTICEDVHLWIASPSRLEQICDRCGLRISEAAAQANPRRAYAAAVRERQLAILQQHLEAHPTALPSALVGG